MIGDIIKVEVKHLRTAQELIEKMDDSMINSMPLTTIGIGGESGCGKSTLAVAIQQELEDKGGKVLILHMDDYFKLPPKSNHQNRLRDIDSIGPQEVHLDMLDCHIEQIRNGEVLQKPLVDYQKDQIISETINIKNYSLIIIEGTYVLSLKNIDVRIFMPRTYLDTRSDRLKRARDEMSDFNEEVLKIEHSIIKKHRHMADFLIDKNRRVIERSKFQM